MWFYNIKKSEIIPLWFIFKLLILIYLEFILLRLSPGFFSTIDSTATSEKISWYFQVSHDYIGQNPMAISHTWHLYCKKLFTDWEFPTGHWFRTYAKIFDKNIFTDKCYFFWKFCVHTKVRIPLPQIDIQILFKPLHANVLFHFTYI